MNRKKAILTGKIVFGIGVLFYLFYKVGFVNIAKTISSINFWYLIPIVIVYSFSFVLTALNFYVLLLPLERKLPFWNVMYSSLIAWVGGLISPGKIGELSIVYLLKQDGVEYGKGLAVSAIDKLVTAGTLIIFSAFALFLFEIQPYRILFISMIGFAGLLFVMFSPITRKWIRKYLLRKYDKLFIGFSKTAKVFITKKGFWALLINIISTTVKWLLLGYIMKLVFLSFGLIIPWWIVLLITSATTLIAMIPVSISGLGVRESSATFLYSMISISPVLVVSVYTVMMLLNYLIVIFVSVFIIKPDSLEDKDANPLAQFGKEE